MSNRSDATIIHEQKNQQAHNSPPWKLTNLLKLSSTSTSTSKSDKTKKVVTPDGERRLGNQAPSTGSDSAQSSSTSHSSQNVGKCYCCGSILTFPSSSKKFRCSICHTTNLLDKSQTKSPPIISLVTSLYVKSLIESCLKFQSKNPSTSFHKAFEPLSTYLKQTFSSFHIINKSFTFENKHDCAKLSKFNVNTDEVVDIFNILVNLPSKQPLYHALKGASDQLKRIHVYKEDITLKDYSYLIVLLEIPFLSRCLVHTDPKLRQMSDLPEIKVLCYDILKRVLGILSCIDQPSLRKQLISWISKYKSPSFVDKINLINLYITFQLKKYFYLANNPQVRLITTPADGNLQNSSDLEYLQSLNLKSHIESNTDSPAPMLNVPNGQASSNPFAIIKSKNTSNKEAKVKVHQYGNDWHINSALIVLTFFYKSNKLKNHPIPVSTFYNSLVDYVNLKLDFDSWQSSRKHKKASNFNQPDLNLIIGYVHGTSVNKNLYDDALYYLCQYPMIISLGGKISVLEYDARRQMERKAEEAFINSLDKRIAIDVYFRIRVRRNYIVQDSLSCIKSDSHNLKKSLKVQFVNEPGVDAGGLRKEWFLLLAKEIFNPQTGMFYNVEDSNLLWFHIIPVENPEMYYLFGAILGLAIYNSTILDLQFPLALYKILLGRKLDHENYNQLFPVSYRSLMGLKKLSETELNSLDLAFEISFSDICGKHYTKDLIPNGKKVTVNKHNLRDYIDQYIDFCMVEGIKTQVEAFKNGFNAVIAGNALSLFSPNEIELLLCGSNDHQIDVDVLKSVTKYSGWDSNEKAMLSNIIVWFWEYMYEISNEFRKKVLIFITGSDRIPATGIQNLSFKINLLDHGEDSNRLPIAHTCFNELALYNYNSKAKLIEKFNKAVTESSGFGIK